MKSFRPKLLMLVSVLTLASCDYLPGLQAQPTPSILPPQPAANEPITLTYQVESYYSPIMGENRTYGVSLPPGYVENPTQRYPVIFLLHGGHGNPKDWFEQKGAALKTLTKLYMSGKLSPSIVITPDGNDDRGSSARWDPQYIDGPHGNVATAVGNELVKVVQSHYRTIPNPDFWAMGGLSSGGWGALNVGLHNLNNFSILFSHSGYFKDKSGPQNSPISYVETIPKEAKKRLRVYLDSGISDTEELEQARDFTQVLKQQKIYNMFRKYPGSHTWTYWREHLADSLTFVGEQFKLSQIAHATDISLVQNQNKNKLWFWMK